MELESNTVHGGLDLEELRSLGIQPGEVLDFSANVSPLGPPPSVRDAVAGVDLAAYPDRQCVALREALSARLGQVPERILVGNGSTELIHLLARAYLCDGEGSFIFTPTFGEYEAACHSARATVHDFPADEANGFRWNLDAALAAIRAQRPRLVFLCNPNNPTGVYLDQAAVGSIAEAAKDSGLLVLDQAYLPFTRESGDPGPLLALGNVVLLRSMTKDYALAGLRVGYMLAAAQVVEQVRRLQPSWSVNAVAQAAALAALDDTQHIDRAMGVMRQAKAYLEGELHAMGVPVLPSTANFLTAKVGDAKAVRLALLRRGICVRDCASFGLPQYIRIGVRRLEDCERLVSALEEVLADG